MPARRAHGRRRGALPRRRGSPAYLFVEAVDPAVGFPAGAAPATHQPRRARGLTEVRRTLVEARRAMGLTRAYQQVRRRAERVRRVAAPRPGPREYGGNGPAR
uniref:Uncharacterized protein n=1 Tax=Micromonospora carbonacea TaxID=47853 RepID=A0A7D5Y4G6_9ACTN|nr:hypothetical protein HZU44_27420 [Micromonospora carbonacea]